MDPEKKPAGRNRRRNNNRRKKTGQASNEQGHKEAPAASNNNNSKPNRRNNNNNNNKKTRNSPQQKSEFEPYQDYKRLVQRYAANDALLKRGKLRVLPSGTTSFVACDRGSLERDIVICTPQDRNRALHCDVVFVELIPLEEDEKKNGNENEANANTASLDELAERQLSLKSPPPPPPSEEQTWQDDSIQASLWNPVVPIKRVVDNNDSSSDKKNGEDAKQYAGKVVFVVFPKDSAGTQPSELDPLAAAKTTTRQPRKTVVGTIKTMHRGGKKIHLLTPNNKSLNQFECPSTFQPTTTATGTYYKAEYIYGTWGRSNNWPPCVNVQPMGETCNVQDETFALLVENGVDHGDFDSKVLENVQNAVKSGLQVSNDELGWAPTPEMYKGRRDYRKQRIFTIDPTTAKDLDDALHITLLPNGKQVEIGVHIADVSYFVTPDSAVDKEAVRRATTVYLVDRVIPMLPRPLCEVACSLNENVERLAFSCVWTMNIDGTMGGNKDNVWYGRSVIRSCARLDYATAQNIIDDKVTQRKMDDSLWPPSRRPTGGHTVAQVIADVKLMHKVAMARRKLRFRNGAIALNGVKLAFRLESDGETPSLCAPYPIKDSNRLVEEYMLMANYLVAQRLITHAGSLAMLRHHPPPLSTGLQGVVEIAKTKGFNIDPESSQSLQQSLSRMGRECDDELLMQIITELLMTPMRPAEYMAAGSMAQEAWKHFALNIPYYTHFTSPIRRYADVIVHRLLQATIDDTVDEFEQSDKEIQDVANHCNEKKLASKTAQDRSDRVFLAIFLKKRPLKSKVGVVISIGEKTFTVFIQELGTSGKLFLDEHKHMLESAEVSTSSKGQRQIKLIRKGSYKARWKEIDIKVFTKIKVSVVCKEKPPIDIKIKLEGPWVD